MQMKDLFRQRGEQREQLEQDQTPTGTNNNHKYSKLLEDGTFSRFRRTISSSLPVCLSFLNKKELFNASFSLRFRVDQDLTIAL